MNRVLLPAATGAVGLVVGLILGVLLRPAPPPPEPLDTRIPKQAAGMKWEGDKMPLYPSLDSDDYIEVTPGAHAEVLEQRFLNGSGFFRVRTEEGEGWITVLELFTPKWHATITERSEPPHDAGLPRSSNER